MDARFYEAHQLVPVYVDGIMEVTSLGTTFETIYFRYVRNGLSRDRAFIKVPAISLIRPKSSVLRKDGVLLQMMSEQKDPTVARRALNA